MAAAIQFDPVAYKRTTREQWQEAAEAWHRWGPQLEAWLGEATEAMLDLARIGPGDRVLDVAAGAGGQSVAAARRVGPEGAVLATDISSNILEYAEREARRAGFANVATRVMDGEEIAVDERIYDAVISRVGLIYFPDQQRALHRMLRALRPGGRVSAIVYSTPERNEFSSIPVSIIPRRAELPVVRGPAPDARRARSPGAPTGVGGDRAGTRPLRGPGRLRGAVRAPRRRGD